MTLRSLSIFPIKSCQSIALPESEVEARGLRFDRRWLVVDENARYLTQRDTPRLARIETKLEADALLLKWNDEQMTVPLEIEGGEPMRVQIWNDWVEARRVGELADGWFGKLLGRSVHLVWMPDEAQRPVDPRFARDGEITSFSDGFPFLVLTQASLDDLNDRIAENGGEPVAANRFRANFVVAGAEPYEEDRWARFRIGECEFEAVKPCSRCVIPTLAPKTGERLGAEPLRTLSMYRKHGGKIYLAQNCLPRRLGRVRVGDEVKVLSWRD